MQVSRLVVSNPLALSNFAAITTFAHPAKGRSTTSLFAEGAESFLRTEPSQSQAHRSIMGTCTDL